MFTLARSFIMLVPPDKIWRVLTDFNGWGRFVVVANPKEKGWGDRWAVAGTPGQGAKLGMYLGDELMQEWEVEQWTPPTRLRVVSRVSHGDPRVAMDSSFDITLTASSPVETKVDIAMETRFTHFFYGFLFSLGPMKKELTQILDQFEQRLVEAIPSA